MALSFCVKALPWLFVYRQVQLLRQTSGVSSSFPAVFEGDSVGSQSSMENRILALSPGNVFAMKAECEFEIQYLNLGLFFR